MQVSLQKAINIVKKNIPNGKIDASIRYRDLYLFKVFIDNGFEKEMDPFYSVNINTGEELFIENIIKQCRTNSKFHYWIKKSTSPS